MTNRDGSQRDLQGDREPVPGVSLMLYSNAAAPKTRRHLSFDPLIRQIRLRAKQLPDPRDRPHCDYSMADAVMSAFALFSLKDPSLLAFEERRNDANMKSLFHILDIPSDTQMRTILDPLQPDSLRPMFNDVPMFNDGFGNYSVARLWNRTPFMKTLFCWPWMAQDISRRKRFIATHVCKRRIVRPVRSPISIRCWERW